MRELENSSPFSLIEKESGYAEDKKNIEKTETDKISEDILIEKEKIFKIMSDKKILRQEDNIDIINLDKFLQEDILDENVGKENKNKPLIKAFSDLKVLSEEDFCFKKSFKGNINLIPLFNISESEAEAFNIDNIKRKKYYLNLWEYEKFKDEKNIEAKNGEVLNLFKLKFAILIFKTLKAERDEKDELALSFSNGKEQNFKDYIHSSFSKEEVFNISKMFIYEPKEKKILKFSDFFNNTEDFEECAQADAEFNRRMCKNYFTKDHSEPKKKIIDRLFFEKTGLQINGYMDEKIAFIAHLNHVGDENKKNELINFIKKNAKDTLNWFLLTKNFYGSDIDNSSDVIFKIIEGGGRTESPKTKIIFDRYRELINLSKNIYQEIVNLFPKKTVELKFKELEKMAKNIAEKAFKLLIQLDKESVSEEEVIEKLEKYQADSVLTLSIFKTLFKEGGREDINFEDIKGITFEAEDSMENLSEEEISQMLAIYSANYADKPSLKEKIVSGFKNKLENPAPGLKIYKMKKNGQVLAFCRFENADDKKYFGSFNVAPETQNSGIGRAFFQKIIEEEMRDGRPLEADCLTDAPITSYYIGPRGGFIAEGISRNYGHSGFDLIHIAKRKESGISYYQNKSEEEITKEVKKNYENSEERFVLEFPKEENSFIFMSEKLFSKGYIMTRYFQSPDKKSAFGAFEKKKEVKEKLNQAA